MKNQYKKRIVILGCAMLLVFAGIIGGGIHFSSEYIEKQLLLSSQNDAVDIAMLINHNFSISDEEVSYLKSLTFNEMERDPINQRLMNTVSGLSMNDKISNIYVMILLSEDEIKYTTDEETAKFFDYKVGTKLNGMWLLNGKFDASGNFQLATREDVYRYLEFCSKDIKVFDSRKAFGLVSEDAWGKFITGYIPIYSTEGTYVGILGVDMDINQYNDKVFKLTTTLLGAFSIIILILIALFHVFFAKYMKVKEGALYYQFYSRLSHDMRTPMNGILGIAALSKDERNPDVLQENINKIEGSGKYLLGLINDTLDLQKMNNGKLELHPDIVDLRVIVNDIKNMVEETARKKNINFEINVMTKDADDYIRADGMRLKQIFVNLLSNAVKFTPNGGNVEWIIDVSSYAGNIAHNVLTIRDNGIGMSEKFIKHGLFRPFAQEYNSTTTQYAGTGLGLSIVKNLVEQMGGHIEVKSKQGEGTEFTVYLDFEIVEASEANQMLRRETELAKIEPDILKGKQILLVEDHPLNAEIAKKMLGKYGCIVTWMDNGEKAVHAFEQSEIGTYDAILMDIRMPVMNGLEAARRIRALNREDGRAIPIIAMTANAYEEDIKKSADACMNAHLAKPVKPKTLYDTLVALIK